MPRIRYLKPEFFTDEDLAELQLVTRLTFAGLWCYADKSGRMEDRPKYLKAMIWPYDNIDIEKQLSILTQPKRSGQPFITRYIVDGHPYIQILSWSKHQKPHNTEAESKFPPIPPLKDKEEDKGNYKGPEQSSELNNVSLTVKDTLKNKEEKQKHKEFVFLTENEFSRLIDEFGQAETEWMIETLDNYIGAAPRRRNKYTDHNRVLRGWVLEKLQVKKSKGEFKHGNSTDGGRPNGPLMRYLREAENRKPNKRMDGGAKEIPRQSGSIGGLEGDGGMPKDASAGGPDSEDAGGPRDRE